LNVRNTTSYILNEAVGSIDTVFLFVFFREKVNKNCLFFLKYIFNLFLRMLVVFILCVNLFKGLLVILSKLFVSQISPDDFVRIIFVRIIFRSTYIHVNRPFKMY